MIALRCAGAPAGARFALARGRSRERGDLRPVARRALRAVLAEIAGRDGDLIETPRGPLAVGAWAGIGASLAYAEDAVLVAAAPGRAIGVDLVAIALPPEWRDLAQAYFAREDAEAIASAMPAARAGLFARAWARREADAKCLGLPLGEGATPARDDLLRLALDAPGFAAYATLRALAASAVA